MSGVDIRWAELCAMKLKDHLKTGIPPRVTQISSGDEKCMGPSPQKTLMDVHLDPMGSAEQRIAP